MKRQEEVDEQVKVSRCTENTSIEVENLSASVGENGRMSPCRLLTTIQTSTDGTNFMMRPADDDNECYGNDEEAEEEEPEYKEEKGGWFADIRAIAGTAVSTVTEIAMNVAAELAELEDSDFSATESSNQTPGSGQLELRLPWEIKEIEAKHSDTGSVVEGSFYEDVSLKEKIMLLALDEQTFLQPYTKYEDDEGLGEPRNASAAINDPPGRHTSTSFVLDEPRITLIRRLLDLDPSLAATHARLSGRCVHCIHENVFWSNYFYHCELTKQEHQRQQGYPLDYFQMTTDELPDDINCITNGEYSVQQGSIDTTCARIAPIAASHAMDSSSVQSESSYVCIQESDLDPAPSSLNSAGDQSIDDLVVVGSP